MGGLEIGGSWRRVKGGVGGEEIVEVGETGFSTAQLASARTASVEMTILFDRERSGEQRWLVQ
jgi:hypothetical protein